MSEKDGGPAFPRVEPETEREGMRVYFGMTLRDYLAVHSTQPGISEITKVAGVGLDSNGRVYTTAGDAQGRRSDEWWHSLTLERQCELSALVRYAQADAMLKAREQ